MRAALLELLTPSTCPGCDAPRSEGDARLCPRCARALTPLPLHEGVVTALSYRGLGARLVQRFKYAGRRDALEVLLEPLALRLGRLRCDAVVPVPRHPQRLRELGRDPVYDLARALARRLGAPLRADALWRRRPTRPQTGLSPAQRRANVAGSFSARPRALRGLVVLLVDDVATTGATLRAASEELLETARARAVLRAALAGTPAPAPELPPPPPSAL